MSFFSRFKRVRDHHQPESTVDYSARIVDSQREILQLLMEWELRISALYGLYASQHPALEPFWQGMARDERAHAAMLASLEKQLGMGHVFWNLGKFARPVLAGCMAHAERALELANAGKVAEVQALRTALQIELSQLDGGFYEAVDSDIPEFKYMAPILAEAEARHLQRVTDELTARDTPWSARDIQ